LLVLHFGFWSWLTGISANLIHRTLEDLSLDPSFLISTLFYWGFPIFGFVSTLAWAYLVRSQNQATRLTLGKSAFR
jgi:hypothetical protein